MALKKLPVDLDELVACMEQGGLEMEVENYLDVESGAIHSIMPGDFEARDEEDLPDWEKPLLPIARAIADDDPRYVPIPTSDSDEDYQRMVRFAESVEEGQPRARLLDALDGRGAFSRFRRALHDYPDVQKRWHAYHDAALREEAVEWLAGLGIEAAKRG